MKKGKANPSDINTIVEEIEIGKGEDISVFQEARLGDTVLMSQEGDSIMYPLLYAIAHMTTGGSEPLTNPTLPVHLMTGFGDDQDDLEFFADRSIDSDFANWCQFNVSGSNPPRLTGGFGTARALVYAANANPWTDRGGLTFSDLAGVIIVNVDGNTAWNGIHTNVTANNLDWDDVDISLNGLSLTGSEDFSNAYWAPLYDEVGYFGGPTQGVDPTTQMAVFGGLVLGKDDTANDIQTSILREPILNGDNSGELQYNPYTLNEPNENLTQQISTITVSREVQNNTSNDIVAKEIALFGFTQNDSGEKVNYYTISRDVIDVTIPSGGGIISFDYSIRTSCAQDGGIMTNFNDMLYRQLTKTSRTVQDINNVDQNNGPSRLQFNLQGSSGYQSSAVGAVVGTDSTVVDEADTSLYNKVPNGINDNELFRIGNYIEGIKIDNQNDKAYFDVISIFENQGSVDVDLNEVGLYTNGPSGKVMIARSVLSTTQTVSPGDVARVVYRFSVTI